MSQKRLPLLTQAFTCWNWKCALLSAATRSAVYIAAMSRTGLRGGLAVVLVEIGYVSLTAGIYAGMQQRALGLRPRWLGNLIVVFGVPGAAQFLDWMTHRITGAAASGSATVTVSIFTFVSALFHLYVMRSGVFITGSGRSLADDFRCIPRLIAGIILSPVAFLAAFTSRPVEAKQIQTGSALLQTGVWGD